MWKVKIFELVLVYRCYGCLTISRLSCDSHAISLVDEAFYLIISLCKNIIVPEY